MQKGQEQWPDISARAAFDLAEGIKIHKMITGVASTSNIR